MADRQDFRMAPKRPWRVDYNGVLDKHGEHVCHAEFDGNSDAENATAALIVYAVNNIDRLTAENAELREALTKVRNCIDMGTDVKWVAESVRVALSRTGEAK